MKIISNGSITNGPAKVLLACFLLSGLSAAAIEFQEPIVLESPNAQAGGYFGAEGVDWVPDVNGDGVVDIIVPALNESPDGSPSGAGRVYVFDGATRELLLELKSPVEVQDSNFGSRVAGIGDLNGNGSGEVIVDRRYPVYVLDGATGELIHTLPQRARSVSPVPDANGDGLPDILVGANGGSAHLYDGATGGHLRSFARPAGASNLYGWSVSGVEDVNGDGAGDVIVSDWGYSSGTGRVFLYDGATGDLLHTLSPPPGGSTGFGRSAAGLEDLNGDGRGDVIVGASSSNGRAYLFDGASGALLHTLSPPEVDNATPQFGWVVNPLPDVTGDGRTEVVALGSPSGASTASAYVFDGVTGAHVATLSGNSDFGGGESMTGMPDVNGDGLGEVLVADYSATASGHDFAGHVLLYLSKAPPSLQFKALDAQSVTVMVNTTSNSVVEIQATSDFQTWEQVTNFVSDGNPVEVKDPEALNHTQRFYRAVQTD